jgi:hypothetical protein
LSSDCEVERILGVGTKGYDCHLLLVSCKPETRFKQQPGVFKRSSNLQVYATCGFFKQTNKVRIEYKHSDFVNVSVNFSQSCLVVLDRKFIATCTDINNNLIVVLSSISFSYDDSLIRTNNVHLLNENFNDLKSVIKAVIELTTHF